MQQSIQGTQTENNLLQAFMGESKARNLYQEFAKVAQKEGFVRIAIWFEEVAQHELSHAKNFSKFFENSTVSIQSTVSIPKIGSTIENLETAIRGELFEANILYPQFAAVAKNEGFTKIAAKFKSIAVAEQFHVAQFQKYLNQLLTNTYFNKNEIIEWYCIKCGYTHSGNHAPIECPACNHPQAYFTPTT